MPLFPSVRELNLRKTSSKPLQQTMKMKRTTSEAQSSSSSSPSSIFPPVSKLENLDLEEIEDLDSVPSLHQLSSLKVLKLHRLEALKNVFVIEKQKEFSTESTTLSFPSLEGLYIEDCPNLKGLWGVDVGEASNAQLPCFPCLSDLSIQGCPNLTSMPLFPSVRKLNLRKTSSKPLQQTMKMKRTTSEAPSSSSSSPSSIFPPFSKLETLDLQDIEDLDSVPSLHQLSSLIVLKLHRLEALKNVFVIERQKDLSTESTTLSFPCLGSLYIEDCQNLEGWWRVDVGEASNAQPPCFPCLSYLSIQGCPKLTSMPLFPSVRRLTLRETRWKPMIQPTMKIKRTTSEAQPSSSSSSSSSSSIFPPFSKLEMLQLTKMDDLDSLPEEFLQNLTSLSYLRIERCINLTSMPEGMQHLTSLKFLRILDCPQLSRRCQMGIGVDWPNIAHIEKISTDFGTMYT